MKKYLSIFFSIAVLVMFAAPGFADNFVGVPEGDPTEGATYVIEYPETDAVPPSPDTYGINSWIQLNLSTIGFSPLDNGEWSHIVSSQWAYRNGGTNMATAHTVNIPSGANIGGYTVWLRDTGGGYIKYWFGRVNLLTSVATNLMTVTTSGTPGTVKQYIDFPGVGHTVDNDRYAYYIWIDHSTTGTTLQNHGVTFWYHLQMSPQPGGATFWDVPHGYWAHRQIEALVRSGITAGCGGGAYCPERNLTRAEMAVFLAKGLGLHWPDY